MKRAFNFSAGPAALPTEVLAQAQQEILDWQGTGMSVMEMSHRSKAYVSIAEQAEADLRTLMGVSDDYAVLFLQGGASTQFSMVPLNLLRGRNRADYFNTGIWSKKAIAEAQRFCKVHIVASSEAQQFHAVPDTQDWQFSTDAAYVHYTPNETIGGVEFAAPPLVGDVPLVADMSSTILSRPIDVNTFGVIYAGAQKNIGPAGLTLVLIRKDLLTAPVDGVPMMLNYKTHADADSMYNTPPTYSWYLAGLVFQWLLRNGGLDAMGRTNQQKAEKLYAAIDQSAFYNNPIAVHSRSWMNIPFTLANSDLDAQFLQEAEQQAGLVNLKGHRSVGGMRASIYNAMSLEGVQALIDFMTDFEQRVA